jgi:hydroxymethylglutaryl-CoA synthase
MNNVMKPNRAVGIAGYGAYVPRFRLVSSEVSELWTDGNMTSPVREKSVPGLDEDVATMSIEAARNAVRRAARAVGKSSKDIARALGAVWVGSESHPYAVKPTSTMVAEALGATPYTQAADWQFACKAGTEAMQAAIGFVGSGMTDFALAIGMDAAQGRPGDALEYTAGAGGAAYVLGPAEYSVATIDGSISFVSDTPDFWRRQYEKYPEHAGRFTGEPAYFHHVGSATRALLDAMQLKASDFAFAVFHQPNVKFPMSIGQELGFQKDQLKTGILVNDIGNTYAGSSMIGLTAVLDVAKPGDRVLLTSFGSGAGSDSFCLTVTERIVDARKDPGLMMTGDYVKRRTQVDYAEYTRLKGNYRLN